MKKLIYLKAIAVLFIVASCSHGKKDQSYVGKVYHNTTAHYNGYYYAKLKMTEIESGLVASRKEDYEKLLPIFLTGNPEDQVSGSDMDSIIKRLTVVVKLHPKSKWSDDAYFNIGKAYFYKKDYESAQATFQFVSSEFKDKKASSSSSSSSKKKKKGKSRENKNVNVYTGTVTEKSQSSGFKMFRHKPIHYTDVLWLVRAHAMEKNYGEANAILEYLDNDQKFPGDLKDDLQLMHAFVFIQQRQYKNATEPMKNAVSLTKDKKDATRYTYILAQLYQLGGDYGTAGKTFAMVSEMRPSNEMDFNARIEVVKNYIASGSGSPSQIIGNLEEMAKNDNFSDFKDQIYYYIGLVQLKQGKDDQAVLSFETSIKSSIDNQHQKGLSFLRIGEMSMVDEDYLTAASPYDSAAAFLTERFDTLDRVKALSAILNNLTRQIRIINTEDSLQNIALMTPDERDKLIRKMVAKIEKEKQAELEESNVTTVFQNQGNQSSGNSSSGGTWYFYNATLRSAGYNDFVKKWGSRENADNWRRSNKKSGDEGELASENTEESGKEGSGKEGEGKEGEASGPYAELLANIPLTAEKMEASNRRIFEAYYTLATIYNSDLHNRRKAVETFESLASRYEGNPDIAKVYYSLYLLYTEAGNASKAESYRQRILTDYSTSVFAAVLVDPDYFKKEEEKENAANVFYASTYDYFKAEQFSDVFTRIRTADSLFNPNPLEAKFDLLSALTIGRTQDRNAYIAALDTVVVKHTTGEEHDKAVEILTLLGAPPKGEAQKQMQEMAKKNNPKQSGPSPYQYKPNNPHFIVVAFNVVDPKTKAISDSLANFNTKNYAIANLKVTSQMLDKNSQMIVVKQFKNREDAQDYYDEITDSETIFEVVESIGYRVFMIDDKNFVLFYQRKNLNEYVEFFEKHYENYEEEDDEEEDMEDEGE